MYFFWAEILMSVSVVDSLCMIETVSLEVLGTRPRQAKQQHFSQNTWDLITKRSAAVKGKLPN